MSVMSPSPRYAARIAPPPRATPMAGPTHASSDPARRARPTKGTEIANLARPVCTLFVTRLLHFTTQSAGSVTRLPRFYRPDSRGSDSQGRLKRPCSKSGTERLCSNTRATEHLGSAFSCDRDAAALSASGLDLTDGAHRLRLIKELLVSREPGSAGLISCLPRCARGRAPHIEREGVLRPSDRTSCLMLPIQR